MARRQFDVQDSWVLCPLPPTATAWWKAAKAPETLNDEKIKKQDRDWVVVSVFLLSPLLGEMIQFDYKKNCSNESKPPTTRALMRVVF